MPASRRKCIVCGRRAVHAHHVVYEQHVRNEGGSVRDPRNLVWLCVSCHFGHHARSTPILLSELTDDAYDFAAELLGPTAAYVYLQRRYAGGDARHEDLVDG